MVTLARTGVAASEVYVSGRPHDELSLFLAQRLRAAGVGVA